ncbi:MAG: type II toxin-antitoxin system RelE/ParE family toxin [Proteobacteria bacterium]|nr:type II toxin-antitoxin system RelE/ParE family toxin [Pseudomonadota bacterium]
MSYNLDFLDPALKEWKALDSTIRGQFKKKLKERLVNPHITTAKLLGSENRYKIKLRSSGFRLVYEVIDSELVIIVIAVGKRDKSKVYKNADKRSYGTN